MRCQPKKVLFMTRKEKKLAEQKQRAEEEFEREAKKTGVSVNMLKGATLGGVKRKAVIKEKEPDYSQCRSPNKNTFFDGSVRVFYAAMLEDTKGYMTIPD
jgi:hypothetical protein